MQKSVDKLPEPLSPIPASSPHPGTTSVPTYLHPRAVDTIIPHIIKSLQVIIIIIMSGSEVKTYALGDFPLASGAVLPQAFIAYKTFGSPSSPAVIYPTWYSGLISDNEWLVGSDKTLDPARYYIIIPALFGNGQSSSPTNMPHLPRDRPFPDVTFRDNVAAQHRLVTEALGVRRARAVLGWSMGAGQTYQWLTQFPGFVDLGVPFCGSARTSLHNQVFLEGPKCALLAAKGAASAGICAGEETSAGGGYRNWTADERERGLRAFGRVYAGWGFSQAFYRERVYETLGYKDLEDFMVKFWEGWFSTKGMSHTPPNHFVVTLGQKC